MTLLSTRTALLAGLAGLALTASPAALAGPDDAGTWYASALGGLTGMSGQRFDYTGPEGPSSLNLSMDPGFLAGAALGYQASRHWRVEAEFAYQTVDHGGGDPSSGPGRAGGDYASTSFALNGLYDFNLFGSDEIRTYAGVGLAWLTEVDVDFATTGGEESYSGDGFGVQLLAGARYDVGDRLFVDAGVRYLLASDVKLEAEGGDGRLQADYAPWAVSFAVGWRF
jgi:opacity protein-like surface antigen